MDVIKCNIKNKDYEIPNCWKALSPGQFVFLSGLLLQYAQREISVADVKMQFVCHVLNIDMNYIPEDLEDVIFQNLFILMSNVTFMFKIRYEDQIWNQLSESTKKLALKTEPHLLPLSPESRILQSKEYDFVLDAVYACQLLPEISLNGEKYSAYTINTKANNLSSSLTAKQYVDATEELSRINSGVGSHALLTAILYCPMPYVAEKAHNLVDRFEKYLTAEYKEAVVLNFQAFSIFLFERTHFRLLWSRSDKKGSGKYSVGLVGGLYNLSADGHGDLNTVYNYPALEYLNMLYDKLIKSVVTLRAGGMEELQIAEKTGLDIKIVTEIK